MNHKYKIGAEICCACKYCDSDNYLPLGGQINGFATINDIHAYTLAVIDTYILHQDADIL